VKHIDLGCKCCDLWVNPSAKLGKKWLYRFNGQDYYGQAALGKAAGLSETQIFRRIDSKTCFRLSSAEVRERHMRAKRKRPKLTGRRGLAREFCRIMATTFRAAELDTRR
jgi:hypothetical protein